MSAFIYQREWIVELTFSTDVCDDYDVIIQIVKKKTSSIRLILRAVKDPWAVPCRSKSAPDRIRNGTEELLLIDFDRNLIILQSNDKFSIKKVICQMTFQIYNKIIIVHKK